MGILNKVYIYFCLAIVLLALLDVNICVMKRRNHVCISTAIIRRRAKRTKAHSTVFLRQHATLLTTETTAIIHTMVNNEMRSSHVRNTLLDNYLNKKKRNELFFRILQSKNKNTIKKNTYL